MINVLVLKFRSLVSDHVGLTCDIKCLQNRTQSMDFMQERFVHISMEKKNLLKCFIFMEIGKSSMSVDLFDCCYFMFV